MKRHGMWGVTGSLVGWLVDGPATYGFTALRASNRLASTDLRLIVLCGRLNAGGARRSSPYTARLPPPRQLCPCRVMGRPRGWLRRSAANGG